MAMHLDATEGRPVSLLDRQPIDRASLAAGIGTVLAVPIALPIVAVLVGALLSIPYVGPLLGAVAVVAWLVVSTRRDARPGVVAAGLVAVVAIPVVVPLALGLFGVALSIPIAGPLVAGLALIACLGWMIRGAQLDDSQRVGGAVASVALHASPLVVWGIVVGLSAVGIDLAAAPPPPPPVEIEDVVQARFVQLGEILDPHQLPDRQVPILRTDVPDPHTAPSLERDPTPPPPRPDHERQRDSVDDALQRISHDAQTFAEAEEQRIREGNPDGIEEGTERTATEGDLYQGRLYTFFRRGWTVPTTISDDDVTGLMTIVDIAINEDTTIGEWRIARSSGNADFDESVGAQLTRLVQASPNIPPPPEEVSAQYLGQHIRVQFSGRNAHR
jgi:hypothetical protein